MVRQHHRLNGHELEQTPGDSGGLGRLVCCSPWGLKELNMTATEQQQHVALRAICELLMKCMSNA